MSTMNAIVWTAYGPPDVLQLRTVPKPTPRDNEVLIKATSLKIGEFYSVKIVDAVEFDLYGEIV